MEELEGLELISKKEKDINYNCDQIINHCKSYKEKASGLRTNLQRIRHAPEFRKKYYTALKLVSNLYKYTNELMLELELTNPLEIEEDCEVIEVPCLPSIDGESQKQQFEMIFLHGSSPWNFWLSHCEENITRRLKELLQKRANNVQELVETPICGDYVLYKQGAQLQRALIQKALSTERYQILNIDDGSTSLIRLKRLFKMDEEVSLIPYQAVNCTLLKDSEDSSLWNQELEEIFSSTLKRCKLTVKIIEENPGYPTCFLVKLKAEDIDDDTELTVDVGKWITKRVIPELKSGSSLSVSVLDAFFNEDDDDDSSDASNKSLNVSVVDGFFNNDDILDASNNKSGDGSSQSCQKSPVIELPNDDDKEDVDSSKESLILEYGTDQKMSLEIVPLSTEVAVFTHPAKATNAQASNHGKDFATNMIKFPTSSKIAANFNESARSNYPATPQNTGMMTVYHHPILPISQTAGSLTGYPLIQRCPNAGTMMGYPTMQRPPNAGSIGGYPINLGASQRGTRYPMEPRPQITNTINPWSTNDYNTVHQSYERPNYELKTPVVLVRPNEELRAVCSYVVSPNEFYVHLENKNNLKKDVMETDLEQFYSHCSSPNYQLRPGFKYCACKYIGDGNVYPCAPPTTWFRAEVISTEGNEAFVFLVDYGVKVWKNINELRVLDQRFFVYDKMAQRCHLHEVPMMGDANYSEDVSEYFKSLLATKDGIRQLNINVCNNVQTSVNSLAVVIKLPGIDKTINDEIIKFIESKDSCEEYEWDPMKEDYCAETNRLDHVIDNPLMATSGYIPKDEERVCKFYAETGRCPKKACRQEHVFIGEDVFTVDRTETFGHTFVQQKLPEEGSKLKVKVLTNACIAATRFYGHWLYASGAEKVKYKYDGEDYDDEEEEEETLITMMNALNKPSNTQKYKFVHLPGMGEMVIVRVIEDDNEKVVWFRAQVTEVHEKFCVVFLIDFGVTKNIPVNQMRAMEPRFLHLPAQATEFCVAGVQVVEDRWGPDEHPTSIISQWEDTVLNAFVIKRNHGSVEVNLTSANGESVRAKLVETGKYIYVERTFGENSNLVPG